LEVDLANINDYAFGIDISHWNASADGKQLVNFDIIAAHQPKVCFIAAKASESNWYKDDRFDYHWAQMKRIGVGRIAYHFMRFDVSGESQAEKLLSVTQDWDWEHDRLCLDCEAEGQQIASQVTDIVNACLERLKNVTGRYPMIYSRKEWVDRKLQVNRMPKVDWWLAAYLKTLPKPLYTPEMTPPPPLPRGVSDWLIHQTTSHGKSIGAPSYYMDYDRWNGTEADVRRYFRLDVSEPEPSLEEKVQILWDAHPELW